MAAQHGPPSFPLFHLGELPGPGREVSNQVVMDMLAATRAIGFDATPLLDSFGAGREAVLDPHGRCAWEEAAVFLDRILDLVGGPRVMEDLGAAVMVGRRALRFFGLVLGDVRHVYVLGGERFSRSMVSIVAMRVEPTEQGVRVEAAIPADRCGSLGYMHASVGVARAVPMLVGLPPAEVRASVAPHRCVIDAIVRADADLAGRVRRSLRALRDLAVPPAAEEALGTLLSSDGLALATGRRWGESLASTDSPEDLADRVFQFLHRTFCTTAMTLEWDLGGERRSIHRGRGPDGAVHERDLVAPGGNVGRLRVDAPFRLAGFEPPILAAALPWIAVAVERLCGPSDWDRRVEAWAAAHALPPRQREALRMLVRGASNKEIAVALGCSVKGAEAHVSRLLRRAAVSSRAEFLAALAR